MKERSLEIYAKEVIRQTPASGVLLPQTLHGLQETSAGSIRQALRAVLGA